MKANVVIQHVASIPGYEKIYIHFSKPKTGRERLLVDALSKPQYVAGKEPKYSLYVGSPVPYIIEGEVARQWTPSYKRFSWPRFWKELRKQNPSYQFECRCGCWSKSKDGYRSHKKNCLTMRDFKVFMNRIENTKLYQEAIADERKDKRQKQKPKASIKRRSKRRTTAVETPKKKVAKRRTRKH